MGELAERAEPGLGGPFDMPYQHNPAACMVAVTVAQCAAQRVAALLAAMPQQQYRALGAWQAELAEWQALILYQSGAIATGAVRLQIRRSSLIKPRVYLETSVTAS